MRYPMKLRSEAKYRIWGGDRLKKEFGKRTDIDCLGETWELTVRSDGISVVENGVYNGMPLDRVIALLGNDAVSPQYGGGMFPLLIKLIDAKEPLSVQVHPDDAYAAIREGDYGKTEMWIVLAADEGAELIYGLREGVGREEFAAAVQMGEIEKVLASRRVAVGDVFFIPSGMVHAIGGGIVLAEIQQNSDLTYRVYDYNRRQKDGTLRELHVEKALDVVRPFTDAEIEAIRYEARDDRDGEATIAHCRYFRTERLTISNFLSHEVAGVDSFHALLCVSGEGKIYSGDRGHVMRQGDCWFIPAKTGEYVLAGDMQVIRATV